VSPLSLMNQLSSIAGCCAGAVLAGLAGLAMSALSLLAGEPIRFSTPTQEVQQPPRKGSDFSLPRQNLKLDFRNPENSLPLPPPPTPIDPLLEKKLRERREENKNWLMNDPEVFRDRFTDPFKAGKELRENDFKSLGGAVDRVFGKPDRAQKENDIQSLSHSTGVYSDQPLFDQGKPRAEVDKAGSTTAGNRRPAQDRDAFKPSSESALKTFFDPKGSSDRLPLIPGMSMYEMLDTAQSKTAKRDREARREEFNRLLSPRPAAGAGLLDPINVQEDQTRLLANPISPILSGSLPLPSKPVLPWPEAGMGEKLAPLKIPAADRMDRLQPSGLSAPAPRAVEDKTRQLETLRLMSRPSILSFPGRSF
jgi:hypothetical protein